jgi:predicted nuclease of restriction endonuclease-like (RecB) superfamily
MNTRKTAAGPVARKAARRASQTANPQAPLEAEFAEVVGLIQQARQRAYQAVNTELVGLYWQIGGHISAKLAAAEWGEGVVESLAQHLARVLPGQRGFTRRNLFRMRQFFETYQGNKKVTPPVTQLPWTHNLVILTQARSAEEREFYLALAARERWSKRELERQLRLGAFEQAVLAPAKLSAALREMQAEAPSEVFKDAYAVEFLNLPGGHSEADLHRGLLEQLRRFLVELGRDFCFVGSEFPLQVGGRDFPLDLLFFHRGLNCLVAIELKVDRFEPAHLGQLNFYLEALDRDVKKPHENPAIGLLLCAGKDDEVVEYARGACGAPRRARAGARSGADLGARRSRSRRYGEHLQPRAASLRAAERVRRCAPQAPGRTLSPAAVAQYVTQLPDKRLLAAKLQEFWALSAPVEAAVPRVRKAAVQKGGGR